MNHRNHRWLFALAACCGASGGCGSSGRGGSSGSSDGGHGADSSVGSDAFVAVPSTQISDQVPIAIVVDADIVQLPFTGGAATTLRNIAQFSAIAADTGHVYYARTDGANDGVVALATP